MILKKDCLAVSNVGFNQNHDCLVKFFAYLSQSALSELNVTL